ncbi:phosphoglucomutase [Entamoeba dispar SAW760]|uniref:Phosphoglucomutase n=2 Tax=Entamoeba dispar TaxID=46681 RepID=PGM_ENTDI|nr:phosphoglucomutase [Entamoeba dispar SAW760]O18719.1 RecName: Full=Phosphoglucomutase; Short=PGM; AltName: Full=Glucose phosphomutase [Entamoeba dispar]EDR24210.1 phosphoglucomutase [Entamoeba dispar SAW760]CAA74797.1 phosphoglucomutase [Entamoeba dispar]|eukprot:EDR24210.1 phosphoglucomutase [Entamoeba dispar SAW760]
MQATVKRYPTTPISGQTMGTSGLRKRASEVENTPNYLENFVNAMFNAASNLQKPGKIIIGGDGRYLNLKALDIIIRVALSRGFTDIVVGKSGFMSTPAESATIIRRKAEAGFIMTASHNPAGKDHGDFGLKLNMSNGGPAPLEVTSKIEESARNIKEIVIAELNKPLTIDTIGDIEIECEGKKAIVHVIDPLEDYIAYLHECFDFEKLKQFVSKYHLKVQVDGFNAVTGIYNKKVFCELLGLPESSLKNAIPMPDFGGKHPDPNLTYAAELVHAVIPEDSPYDIGFAFDGDGDRNLIVGRGAFVSPSDSLAILSTKYNDIPFFVKNGFKGVARSMPTSAAVDHVTSITETPTGWKFFGNLMDSGKISLCGEESFGTGCCGIREKDGIWAALCWVSILAAESERAQRLVGVKEILENHWAKYGRNYYQRYDFDEVDKKAAEDMMQMMRDNAKTVKCDLNGVPLKFCDDFEYHDSVDGSVTSKQGIRFVFEDGSRIIFRLSGTGSVGATIRVYFDKYSKDYKADQNKMLADMVTVAYAVSQITKFTGREKPSVVT